MNDFCFIPSGQKGGWYAKNKFEWISYSNVVGRSKDETGATPEGAIRWKSKSDSYWE